MEILFLLFYAAIIALVSPYVGLKSERYGILVPAAIASVVGSVLWAILTWVGLSHTDGWIWTVVMLAMPASAWFGANRLAAIRAKH